MYELYFDGGANPNPGHGGCGAVIIENGIEIDASSCYLNNNTTNNVAEYNGLIIGLELALKHNIKNLIVKGDSQLVIKQMQKLYKVKAAHLIEYYDKANKLLMEFDTIEFIHVKRHLNARADELASLAIINK